jgi:hypothetical protein
MRKLLPTIVLLGSLHQASAQNNFGRFALLVGSARSFSSGDEYIYGSFQWPLPGKFHGAIHGGWRASDVKTLETGLTAGYAIYSSPTHRLYAKTDVSFFLRDDFLPFDDQFWRHSVGIGYSTRFWRKFFLNTEVNPIGLYYGTRNDPQPGWDRHPNLFEAGEVKFALGFAF